MDTPPLLRTLALGKRFAQSRLFRKGSQVAAVSGVNLQVGEGKTLGIVGESGCGKSTLARMLVGLLEPSEGDVFIRGLPLYDKKAHSDYQAFRHGLAGTLQMVFQDPQSSLNPRMRVGESVAEPLRYCVARRQADSGAERPRERAERMLAEVGLDADAYNRYPHEFSGGQRQRIAIARALITRPDIVVCDEPTSSLDASVQAQVLNLLLDLQRSLGASYVFISHDLAVVRHMSDRVAVMYRGYVVEEAESEAVFSAPRHPYTQLLLASLPDPVALREECARGNGGARDEAPSSAPDAALDKGCPFLPRCGASVARCAESLPDLLPAPGAGGAEAKVRCHLFRPS